MRHCLGLAAALLCSPAIADITLIGTATIPGHARDKSGLSSLLRDGSPHDRLGSFGSGIAWTGRGNRYIAVDDRGPADGGTSFRDRFQTFDIVIEPERKPAVSVTLLATTLLTSGSGDPLVGAAGAFDAADQRRGLRLDPEGIRVSLSGSVWLSDEYGPWIDEFSIDGRRLQHLAPPPKFLIAHPSEDAKEELRERSGRQANRGFEGLAITPGGSKLYAILQSPLIQDGGLDADGQRRGVNVRILELEVATAETRELIYQLSNPANGVSEILAINDHEFLVLERDGKQGKSAKSRRLVKIDLRNATDVSKVESLPAAGLPPGVVPAARSPFLDLMDPRFGLGGPSMPEKIEGITFGPDLPDGRRVLIVTTDNDLSFEAPSIFWIFAFESTDLPE